MPRQPRLDYPGAWHHLTNRGRNKQVVFVDAADYQLFLDLLAIAAKLHNLEVHSFCLMSNHYHVLVRSRTGDLSAAMQFLGSQYALDFNQNHGFDGGLFKGRFYSKVIEDEIYLMEAIRYIPNNPVKAGLVEQPEHYRWSSYPYTLGFHPAPQFLDTKTTIDWLFGGDLAGFDAFIRRSDTERARLFAHAVESHDNEQLLSVAIDQIKAARHRFDDMSTTSPACAWARTLITDFVCDAFELPLHAVLSPNTSEAKAARLLLLTLLFRHSVAELSELATAFGYGARSGAYSAVRRFEEGATANTRLYAKLQTGLSLIPLAA